MSSAARSLSPAIEQTEPCNAHLLQNSSLIPEENLGFATNMGPLGAVFVAKLSAVAAEANQTPQSSATSLLARVQSGGLQEYLGINALQTEPTGISKPGRPAALNEGVKNKICMLLALGYSRSLAAAELGIARSTITRTMQRDKAFYEAVLRAEELYERTPLLTIMDAARRNWRAAAWLLKNHKPHQSLNRRKRRQANREWTEATESFFTHESLKGNGKNKQSKR